MITYNMSAPVNSATLCMKYDSTTHVMLCFFEFFLYFPMKDGSLHRDYMCLVTVHSWNWCLMMQMISMWLEQRCRNTQFEESQLRGKSSWLDTASEGVFQQTPPVGGKKSRGERLAQRWQLNASFSWCYFHTEWKNSVTLTIVTLRCRHRNTKTWEGKGHILLTVSPTFTCRSETHL